MGGDIYSGSGGNNIDVSSWGKNRIAFWLIGLFIAVDAIVSYYGVKTGVIFEVNPFMNKLVFTPKYFFMVKIFEVVALVYFAKKSKILALVALSLSAVIAVFVVCSLGVALCSE